MDALLFLFPRPGRGGGEPPAPLGYPAGRKVGLGGSDDSLQHLPPGYPASPEGGFGKTGVRSGGGRFDLPSTFPLPQYRTAKEAVSATELLCRADGFDEAVTVFRRRGRIPRRLRSSPRPAASTNRLMDEVRGELKAEKLTNRDRPGPLPGEAISRTRSPGNELRNPRGRSRQELGDPLFSSTTPPVVSPTGGSPWWTSAYGTGITPPM